MKNVFEMVTKDWEDVYKEIGARLKANEEYKEASEKFEALINTLDKRIKLDLSNYACAMEQIAQDEGYSKGFSDAVNLMAACFYRNGAIA